MTDTKQLREFRNIIRKFNQIDNRMQVSTVLALVEIALADRDGRDITTKDMEKYLGVLSGTASRNTYYWGEGHKSMSGGFKYVDIDFDKEDRRRRSLTLTERGKYFINSLVEKPDGETEREPMASGRSD